MLRPLLLAAALSFAVAVPAFASDNLDAARAQLQVAIDNNLDPSLIQTLRDLVAMLEQEEAEQAAANAESGSAPDADAPADGAKQPIVPKRSYFAEIGRNDLASCTAAGDIQIDSLCTAAMLRYSDYMATVANGEQAAADEMYDRHAKTAQAYIQALEDFKEDPANGLVEDGAQ